MTQVQMPVWLGPYLMGDASPLSGGAFSRALASVQNSTRHTNGRAERRDRAAERISKFSPKQSNPESCASAVLLCACLEMKLIPPVNRHEQKAIEASFFREMVRLKEAPARDGGVTNLSVARVAKMMGIESTISLSTTTNPGKDGHEQAYLLSRAKAAGINVEAGRPIDRIDDTCRRIVMVDASVKGGDVSGHALLERPDGSLMDPADGSNHQSLAHLNRTLADRGISYRPFGVTINLKRPN